VVSRPSASAPGRIVVPPSRCIPNAADHWPRDTGEFYDAVRTAGFDVEVFTRCPAFATVQSIRGQDGKTETLA